MRFMVIIKSDENIEGGAQPTEEQFAAMGKFNEDLVKAGVMLAGEGLLPSSKGARVHLKGNDKTVIDGPFAESKELIAGFWLLDVKSRDEAIEWVKRMPVFEGEDSVVEIRQVAEASDFGDEFTPELRAAEDALREQLGQ
ncbi:YciI family protein [Umezawaea endophytica]|uniref:YciI family protein n=1 Tax=Umezawaea endophytica TaxID=1654476 RepID=A0A9X3A728_9PSEU|nr:YciI family protein [Umezawaea endophytica]MCS7483973.1 YciI family protein [Umezawaea endophytica]